MRPFLVFLTLIFALLAGQVNAELGLFGAAAVGEADWHPANDLGGSGALWQGGLSLQATSPFAMAFLQPWLAWYNQGPAFEIAAGAGIGLPISLIRGHVWLAAEGSLHSVDISTFPVTGEPGQPVDGGGPMVRRRELRRAFGPSFRVDAWRAFGALTFLSDGYPMWRIEVGYRLVSW